MKKKNVLLTALVLGSLMSCNVVWGESITDTVKDSINFSDDTTITAKIGVQDKANSEIVVNVSNGKGDLTIDASDSGVNFGENKGSITIDTGMLNIKNADVGIKILYSNNNKLFVTGKTIIENAGVAVEQSSGNKGELYFNGGLEIKNCGTSSPNGNSAIKLQGYNMKTSYLTIDGFTSTRDAYLSLSGIEVNSNSVVDVSRSLKINNIQGIGQVSGIYTFGASVLANDMVITNVKQFDSNNNNNNKRAAGIYNLYGGIEAKSINIDTIHSKDTANAYGLNQSKHYRGNQGYCAVENIDVKNVIAENGIAYGVSNTDNIFNYREENNETEFFNVSGINISKIYSSNNAYGLYSDNATTMVDNLIISDVRASNFAVGLSVNNIVDKSEYTGNQHVFDASNLNISNISSANMATGFSIKQATAENIDTAYINLDGTSEDYTGLQNDVKKVAIMADAGGNVKMTNSTNGNYEIYGALVASGDGTSAGNIDLNGANTVIKGDVFAVNGGKANITLNGVNSLLEGQVDDYFNMGGDGPVRSTNLYDSEGIEKTIAASGSAAINLDGGTWMARGRSVVSELAFDNAGGLVDITKDIGASVTTKKLSGNGMFKMNLNASVDRANNNMLYVSDSFTGAHKIDVVLAGNTESINETNKVRFATVNGTGTFEAGTVDGGVFNLGYTVGTDKYDKNSDDSKYNGVDNGDGTYKPGEKYVDAIFDGATNWYLTGVKKEEKSDAGKTIINMSRANYKNAVYMDRLNKRMGEARYIDGDEGLWVRMRHDRIGMENAFRSSNTAYEIGYDRYQVNDGGEHRIGMAFDYMKGDTSYDDILGEGETKRVGFWAYDTWLGDNGHYSDYVAKWGHLSNEFDITAKTTGEGIAGDYSNNVFSLSAEYGRKKDIGNDWYIEPQVQLQFARVTDAEYMTSQNTAVELDGYNSLIGRLGFRLGKDMNVGSECQQNVYVKADLLHEFMAEQDISAADKTGTLHESFENEGTWYDLGIGYSVKMNKDSYMYVDFEKSFGNDNDETYQINVGANWAF